MKASGIVCIASLIVLGGCADVVYESTRSNELRKCDLLPTYSEVQKCKEDFDQTYDEYKEEREAIVKETSE